MEDAMVLTREERIRRCSIDCADSVSWTHWSVGGEYSRKLVLKNTHDKLQVIEYKLPQRKATFFVDFPAPVSLSSGMAFELEIKFRPTDLVEFHDGIEISVRGRGSFRIGLDALTPFARLDTPEFHDFEFCAVGATATKPLTLSNTGTIPLDFYWELPEPFDLQPRMGSLPEGETLQVHVSFSPREATSMLCRAVCKRAGTHEVLSCLKLSGIGKYAFVSFSEAAPPATTAQKTTSKSTNGKRSSTTTMIDFGCVLTKSSATRSITIQNNSCVDAQFTLKRIDKDIVCPFTVTPSKGIVPRDGTVQFQIRYSPAGSGAHAANDFVCQTVGGNVLTLRCRGTSVGPTASLSTTKLEFGDVDLDLLTDAHAPEKVVLEAKAKLDRFVTLRNTTDAPIQFQFVGSSPGAAFAVNPCGGQIAARGTHNIKVTFHPTLPMNYLRRLFVLVNDTENALFLDVLGTGYCAKSRPAPFTAAEARAFFARQEVGLGRCTPEDLAKLADAIREDEPITSEDDAAARDALRFVQQERAANLVPGATLSGSKSTSKKQSRSATSLTKILPSEEAVASAPFVLDRSQMIFRGFASEGELVSVRNNTSSKATASWCVPQDAPWSVTPEVLDVAPFSSASFRVRVSGNVPNASFGSFLECYVNFKQMRSFRLVSEDTFCPPHCLLLQCQRLVSLGDTASAPFVEAPSQVAFPPCREQESVLQVVSMVNKSDTVAAFSIQVDAQVVGGLPLISRVPEEGLHIDPEEDEVAQRQALSTVFTCFPSSGVIPPKETMLLLLKFNPPKNARFVGMAKVQVNDSPQASKHIALRGEGFVPKIEVDGKGVILFRPTSVGGSTQRTYTLRNPSRIPVRYDIQVQQPPSLPLSTKSENLSTGSIKSTTALFELEPSSGVIDGYGTVSVRCTFSPSAPRRFEARVTITGEAATSPSSPLSATTSSQKSQLTCQAVGEGMIGVVSVEPSSLSYGHVLVGESRSQQVAIFNSSLCDLQYELRWIARSSNHQDASAEAPSPDFINGRGVIRARSHVSVHVCLQPIRGSFEYILYVIVGGSEHIYLSPTPSLNDVLRLPHCVATVVGASPCLQFSDVRSVLQPKSQLWRQLSLTAVNEELRADITPADANKTAFSFDQAMEGLKPIHCDLGVDVFRTTPIKIMARLDNTGTCAATFRVWLPNESEIPNEPWHQTKLYSNEVAEVLDAGLFDVYPRDGVIPAGGHTVLSLSYRHTRIGSHQLPMMLMLEQGKRVLLVLSARTLEENAPYLYFHHSMEHTLSAVAVGDLEPPLQYTELQNLSHRSVQYTVDEGILSELREANYDFPILQCLNPSGVIPPMSTMLLSWYFRPLEAKHYATNIRIETEDLGGEGGALVSGGGTAAPLTSSYTIKLLGDGYHPKKVSPLQVRAMHSRDFLEVPRFPTLLHPLLPVRLSMDVLRYGSIPFHSLHRQVVSIKNHHASDAFLFEWHCVLQYGDQIFDIDPPRGRLEPGESATCRITLYSGSTSHILDNPIHCHVLNDDLRKRRQCRRDEVKREAAMELGEGDEADELMSGGGASAAAGSKRGKQVRPRIRQPITTVPAKFQNTKRLREAIQSITEAVVAEDVDEHSDDLMYVEVLPTVLELLVQARIMPMDGFREIYGETAGRNFFYPTLSAFRTTVPPNTMDLHDATQSEWSLVHDILEDMMKEVVHHADIVDAFRDCSEDPVPYFMEMVATTEGADGGNDTNASSPVSKPVSEVFAGVGETVEPKEAMDTPPVPPPPSGDLQCLIEEVLESAIYGIVQEAQGDDGVVTNVALKKNRSNMRQLL